MSGPGRDPGASERDRRRSTEPTPAATFPLWQPDADAVNDQVSWPTLTWEEQSWEPMRDGPGLTRRHRTAGRYRSAVPASIATQGLALPGTILADLDEATARVAAFDAEGGRLSGPLLGVLLRSESSSSSQIEQITASARAIAEAQVTGEGTGNAALIAANVHAMAQALQEAGPITADRIERVQRAILHRIPDLAGWRREPVWIGGGGTPITADFVPPDHHRIPAAIDDLVAFTTRDDLPVLAQAAIAHAQFETIHPFADGNGRTGRALVHLVLHDKGLTTHATVPVSGGLLVAKRRYFDALTAYRDGNAGPILTVFAHAALHAADRGRELAARIIAIQDGWRRQITARSDSAIWRVIDVLPEHPVGDAEGIAAAVGSDPRNIHRQLRTLVDAGILVESRHHKSRRYLFRAPALLAVLDDYADEFGRRSR